MITELQTSYDSLLQRYAAAENALDKVELKLSKQLPDWIIYPGSTGREASPGPGGGAVRGRGGAAGNLQA